MDILSIRVFLVVAAVIGAYALLILVLEIVIWRVQPSMEGGVTLTINDGDETVERVLYGHEFEGALYVSSNHWFRRWYYALLENPDIVVARGDAKGRYTVVSVEGDEAERVRADYQMGFVLRLVCAFAPRKFVRLDPAASPAG